MKLNDAILLNVYITSGVEHYTDMLEYVLEIIGIPNDKSKAYYHKRDFVRNLLANLLISWRVDLPVMYHRDKNYWSVSSRYIKLFMRYDTMVEIIDLFLNYGFIDHTMGHWSKNDQIGKVSRISPTEKIIQIFKDYDMGEVDYLARDKPNEVIHLKDENKKLILYKDTRKIKRMRSSLENYNNYIQDQSVSVSCKDVPLSDKHVKTILGAVRLGMISNLYISLANSNVINGNPTDYIKGEVSPLTPPSDHHNLAKLNSINLQNVISHNIHTHTSHNIIYNTTHTTTHTISNYDLSMCLNYLYLHRSFNRRLFTLGGRFFGAIYQMISRNLRPHITINGHPTIELDYSALHPRMLYHMINMDYQDDPYIVLCDDPAERKQLKFVVMISINCPTETSIEYSVQKALRKKHMEMIPRKQIEEYVERFKKYHQPIARFIHSGMGIKLQYTDSCIVNEILKRCIKENIPCLTIHDSAIVPLPARDFLEQVMNEEYEKVMGFKPVIH